MMNKEIKLILNIIKDVSEHKEGSRNGLMILSCKDYKTLYDYITNLQQENKIRQQDINNLAYQLAKMKEENEYLKLSNPEMNIEHFRVINENKRKIDNLRKQNKDLQQENYELKSKLECYENGAYYSSKVDELEQENERLNNLFEYNMQTLVNTDKLYEDYKSRCEKAIDKLTIKQARFINEKNYVLDDNDLDEIMYILQKGSDDNE